MKKSEIKQHIQSLIEDAKAGLEVESNKVDFKRKWYDLSTKRETMELLKDVSSIANTPGGDGFLVIGVDDKTGKIFNESFKANSGLKDETQLLDKLSRHLDPTLTINLLEDSLDGESYSIIHIPPSNHKPHLIKSYLKFKSNDGGQTFEQVGSVENELFIRRGTSSRRPKKFELDELYRYRHEHVADIDLVATANPQIFTIINKQKGDGNSNHLYTTLIIENIGYRPVSIEQIILTIDVSTDEVEYHEVFRSYSVGEKQYIHTKELIKFPIVIRSGDIAVKSVGFRALSFQNSTEFQKILRGTLYDAYLTVNVSSQTQPLRITLTKP